MKLKPGDPALIYPRQHPQLKCIYPLRNRIVVRVLADYGTRYLVAAERGLQLELAHRYVHNPLTQQQTNSSMLYALEDEY